MEANTWMTMKQVNQAIQRDEFREKIQIIVAKMGLGIRLTVSEKKFILRHKAADIVRADRKLARAA